MSIQKISTSIFALLLAFAFHTNAAPLNIISSAAPTKIFSDTDFSGEDYFRGIYFGNGPVAARIPATRDISAAKYTSDKTLLARADKFQETLISKINASDKSFFRNFKNMMTSGNHNTVQKGIEMGASVIEGILEADPTYGNFTKNANLDGIHKSLTSDLTPEEATKVVNKYLENHSEIVAEAQAREMCLAAAAAVAVAVWLAVWKYTYFWSAIAAADSSAVLKEQIVDSVVKLRR